MADRIRNKPDLEKLERQLGIKFKDQKILFNALIHRSYLNENKKGWIISNERLEFLGDAVLELAVTDFLYHRYQNNPEGDLTNLRAKIVCTQNLAKASQQLSLGEFVLLSKGEELQGGRKNSHILADLFEAILGAIYLDQGWLTAKTFIKKQLLTNLPLSINRQTIKDPKSIFQELAQQKYKKTPVYKTLQEKQLKNGQIFTVGLFLDNKLISQARGRSKKEAQEKAAQEALKIITKTS